MDEEQKRKEEIRRRAEERKKAEAQKQTEDAQKAEDAKRRKDELQQKRRTTFAEDAAAPEAKKKAATDASKVSAPLFLVAQL